MLFCESFKKKSRKVFLATITLTFSDKESNHIDKPGTPYLQIRRA